jgi:hypothetical protein
MICWNLTAFGWLVPCTRITSGKGTPGTVRGERAGPGISDIQRSVIGPIRPMGPIGSMGHLHPAKRQTPVRGSAIPKIEAGNPESGTTEGKAPWSTSLINIRNYFTSNYL